MFSTLRMDYLDQQLAPGKGISAGSTGAHRDWLDPGPAAENCAPLLCPLPEMSEKQGQDTHSSPRKYAGLTLDRGGVSKSVTNIH